MLLLACDPGESTGWSSWEDSKLKAVGTESLDAFVTAWGEAKLGLSTRFDCDPGLVETMVDAEHLVIEDWALYPWKAQELAWDKCRTARGIGALSYICDAAGVPYTLQPAKIKDQAVAAGAEAYFKKPLHENRHLNDSIMHAVYFQVTNGVGV